MSAVVVLTLTADELRALIRDAVADALGAQRPARLLTPRELAAELGVSVDTIERRAREGLPHVLVGTRRRFDAGACRAWLAARPKASSNVVALSGRRAGAR